MEEKEIYINLIKDHKRVLAKARNMLEKMLNILSVEIDAVQNLSQSINNEKQEDFYKTQQKKFWWGDKESASSILSRLVQLLLKLLPLEQELYETDLKNSSKEELENLIEKTKIDEEDIEILEGLLERRRGE
jgi:hypothetical protein